MKSERDRERGEVTKGGGSVVLCCDDGNQKKGSFGC